MGVSEIKCSIRARRSTDSKGLQSGAGTGTCVWSERDKEEEPGETCNLQSRRVGDESTSSMLCE